MCRLIYRDFKPAFETVDAIVTPVSPLPALKLGATTSDPLELAGSDQTSVEPRAETQRDRRPAKESLARLAWLLLSGAQLVQTLADRHVDE